MSTESAQQFEGQSILITGANRGLGEALVTEALARGAAEVFAVTRAPMDHHDKRVVNVLLDLTDAAAVSTALGGIPRLDLVVNNAGHAMLDDVSDPAVLQQHLDVNVFGPHAVVMATKRALVEAKGSVINVLSIAAIAPAPIIPSYSISKAAALSLTLALRSQLAPSGVSVHAALPGPIDTEMSRDLDAAKASPEDVATAIFNGVAAGALEIFPDPMSEMFSGGWEDGPTKVFERAQSDFSVADAEAPAPEESFTLTWTVPNTSAEVYAAVTNPRGWWSLGITGGTTQAGDVFDYSFEDVHACRVEITEAVPNERVSWKVLENTFNFVADEAEWVDTEVIFEITPDPEGTRLTFTHHGLVPSYECYDVCSSDLGWGRYAGPSLRNLITTGTGLPNPADSTREAWAPAAS